MESSSSSGMKSKAELNKRLKTGEPSPSPYLRMINSLWSTSRTTKSEFAKIIETGELMPVEFFNQNFPVGYHFEPNDHELLQYLREKILRILLRAHHIIEANVYAHPPEYLADTYTTVRENVWYFFTPGNGVGSESLNWKASGPSTPITKNEKLLGFKKSMDYFQGNEKSDWAIVEYSLNMDELCLPMPKHVENWTLCELFRKSMINNDILPRRADEEVDQNFVTWDF